MTVTAKPHILISIAAAVLLLATGLWCSAAQTFADEETAQPESVQQEVTQQEEAVQEEAVQEKAVRLNGLVQPAANQVKEEPIITYQIPKNLNLHSDNFNLNARTENCDAPLSYSSPSEGLKVDEYGNVTILDRVHCCNYRIDIHAAPTPTTTEKTVPVWVFLDWVPQKLTCPSTMKTTMGKSVTIKASALGELLYSSCDKTTATVSSTGKVRFLHPGKVKIRVQAMDTGVYGTTIKYVTVTCRMTAPSLKVTRPKKRCAKLTWSKVGGAQQYMIYVKYPGKSKYTPIISKSSKVKSVTHKGLKKGKKYSYKVRACLNSRGDIYYGPFSKAKTVRIK